MKQQKIIGLSAALLIIVFLFSGLAVAQKSPKDEFDFPPLHKIKMPDVEEKTLSNGLKLFLVEDHKYPTISMRAMIHTGSVYESPEKIGLASVTGQVLRTGGTETMSGDQIDNVLETMAASIETGIGRTSGYVNVSMLKENIDQVLPIMADILMHPVFNQDKIDLAKMQQKTAISRRNDDVSQITNREFNKLIYGADSPYARHSEYATIDAITREDINSFYKKYFHPNNMIMAVWGDFQTKKMLGRLEDTFSEWESVSLDMPAKPKVNYNYEYTVNYVHKPDVNQSNIMLGHIGGIRKNPDYPALIVMNRILSFDRMFKKIRTNEGLAYSVWGSYGSGFTHPGVFSAGAQTKSQSTVRAIELMLQEIERITREEVTDEELDRAKDQYLNSFVFNFDSKAKIVQRMMSYAYHDYSLDFATKLKQEIEKVGKADILRVAKKYLNPEKVQILVVGNKEDFDKPLSTLGDVNEIDITIPQPEAEKAPEATKESMTKGREIFEKTMAALGGIEKLKNIKNYSATMDITQVTPMGEMNMAAEVTLEFPDKVRYSISTPGGEVLMIVNKGKGWMKGPGGTAPLPAGQKKEISKDIFRDPINIAKNMDQLKIQYIGKKKFDEKDAIDLLISNNGNSFHYYINPDNSLLIGISYQGMSQTGPVEKQEIFSDYRTVHGLNRWFKTISKSEGKKEGETTITDMKYNISIEDGYFTME